MQTIRLLSRDDACLGSHRPRIRRTLPADPEYRRISASLVAANCWESSQHPARVPTPSPVRDRSPLPSGYTGVINLDTQGDGISALYDTLCSELIPEPATTALLGAAAVVLLPRRQRTRN